jgi:hypothetical protein
MEKIADFVHDTLYLLAAIALAYLMLSLPD